MLERKVIILATIVLGILIVSGAVFVQRSLTSDRVPAAATAEYGRQILRQTAAIIGPGQADPEMRYSGSHLACASCHINTGAEPGTLSLFQTSTRYPRFSGRDGREGDLRDRINGCMERSMNGRLLPRDSAEMIAMEAYILDLGNQYSAMGESSRLPDEPAAFKEPDRMADVEAGEIVYQARCELCHGKNGEGLAATVDINDGYLFPPLWGSDSYNNGAGMTRVLTAGRYIKARMPLGNTDLSDDESYDVSAYINSQSRPEKSGLENDYPDLTRKPVDSPYPPYADQFSREQHRLGPFAPIREYYDSLKEAQ
ncbi:MAG: c-type cytochrome [Proteobacteria bacterium]|nr:c-type cytochrome [Pseudomonadota bacterium]